MEESGSEERAKAYLDILKPALANLRKAFALVVNEHGDISEFQEAIRELDNARQLINSMDNIGLVVGIFKYLIVPFLLTGDPVRDIGQTPIDLPES